MSDPAGGTMEAATMARVNRRLLPFLFLLYIVCFIDRTNVSFAALQMNRDVGLSDAVYGLGAGVFFLGYALFEVPSNLVLARVGARRWIGRIAITWGVLAMGMLFVRSGTSFLVCASCWAWRRRATSPASSTTSASGFRSGTWPGPPRG